MRFILSILVLLTVSPAFAGDPQNPSGLPLPRFVSLKSAEVNIRSGPGTRYPIQWVYHREGLPVEIAEEFDLWRKIRDSEGVSGWVHKSMLGGTRTALVKGKEARVLREDPEEDAPAVLKAAPSVIGKIAECKIEWCRMQIGPRKGWIKKAHLWGVYPKETIK